MFFSQYYSDLLMFYQSLDMHNCIDMTKHINIATHGSLEHIHTKMFLANSKSR